MMNNKEQELYKYIADYIEIHHCSIYDEVLKAYKTASEEGNKMRCKYCGKIISADERYFCGPNTCMRCEETAFEPEEE